MASLQFREEMTNMLEAFTAAKMDGDVCIRLESEFGDIYRQGQTGSPYHAGLLFDPASHAVGTAPILGIVIKMAEVKIIDQGGSLFQRLDLGLTEQQKKADVLILVWPHLHKPDQHWTVLKRGILPIERLQFTIPYYGGIEQPVPPHFWPHMTSVDEGLSKIKALYEQKKQTMQQRPDTEDHILNTVGQLTNNLLADATILFNFLHEKCASSGLNITLAKYRSVNPDMAIKLQTSYRTFEFFMEASLGQCSIQETDKVASLIKVSHAAMNTRKADPFFSILGPRWTFFLAEVSLKSERIDWGNSKVPKMMLLLHRSIIPEGWWTLETEKLESCFDSKYLVDMTQDVPAQMRAVMLSFGEEKLKLPPLEDFSKLSREQNAKLHREAVA